MKKSRARQILQSTKHSLGLALNEAKRIRQHPANYSEIQKHLIREEISLTQIIIHNLQKEYGLGPIKVKQTELFQ
jgi:hypothetical protein